jgi:thiosulfate dehydrogenase
MLKSALAGVVLTFALLFAAAFALVESGYIPANADAIPGRVETWIAITSLHTTLNREAPKEPNPVAMTDENLLTGVHLFAQNCAVCHGDSRGLPAASPIAKGLYQNPPQMATEGVEDDPDGMSFWKIKHGIRLTGMPSFGSTLSDKEIWTLALFLKHMDKLPPAPKQAWKEVRNWPLGSR